MFYTIPGFLEIEEYKQRVSIENPTQDEFLVYSGKLLTLIKKDTIFHYSVHYSVTTL